MPKEDGAKSCYVVTSWRELLVSNMNHETGLKLALRFYSSCKQFQGERVI